MKIFLSYRRADSQNVTDRIYDRLVTAFGRDNVFKDVDSIGLGENFRDKIKTAIDRSEVALVVIGKSWLQVRDTSGRRRLENDDDPVRLEIEHSLARGLRLIPLIVDGAAVPSQEELPASLRDLANLNGAAVRPDPDFHHDMEKLITSLGGVLPDKRAEIEKLDAEIGHRLQLLRLLIEPIFTFTQKHTANAAVTGIVEERPNIGKLGEFVPLFPEFAGTSLFSLIWRLLRLVPDVEKPSLSVPIDAAKKLPSYFQRLIMLVPRGEDDSKWHLDPQFLDEYRDTLQALQIGRW